jgi:hypothetical protein
MATTPFSDEFVARLKQATGWRFNAELGPVFTPRFFCCSSPNDLGISDGKEPVAVLELTPNPCLVGDVVAYDGRDSYDPDGAIVGHDFTFEDGNPPDSVASNGNVTWAAVGEYIVTLVVTDGTGLRSSPARQRMIVQPPMGKYYFATSNGVWFFDNGNWAARNGGLVGTALQVNDIKIDPATKDLPEENKVLWAATDGGLYLSINGAGNWTEKNPDDVNNTWDDTPAPTIADLEFQKVLIYGDELFVIATWQNGAGAERSFLFHCLDAGSARANVDYDLTWEQIV